MPFLPIIGSIVSAGMSIFGAMSDKKAGKANAALIKEETAESRRRLADVQKIIAGEAVAKGAASGVKVGVGSQALFIKTLKSKQAAELSFLESSGASRAEIEEKIGQAKATQGFGKAFGSLLGAGVSYSKLP